MLTQIPALPGTLDQEGLIRLNVARVAVFGIAAGIAALGCGGSLAKPDAGDDIADMADIADDGPIDNCLAELPAQAVPGTTCQYAVPEPPCTAADRAHIGVIVAGRQIPQDPNHLNGWDYTDPGTWSTIAIYGPTCDAITSGAVSNVTIAFRVLI